MTYSFTTSVSIRFLPGLGEDILNPEFKRAETKLPNQLSVWPRNENETWNDR